MTLGTYAIAVGIGLVIGLGIVHVRKGREQEAFQHASSADSANTATILLGKHIRINKVNGETPATTQLGGGEQKCLVPVGNITLKVSYGKVNYIGSNVYNFSTLNYKVEGGKTYRLTYRFVDKKTIDYQLREVL